MKSIIIKNTKTTFGVSLISLSLIGSSILLSGCSEMSSLLKSDDAEDTMQKDTSLIIPPSLRLPEGESAVAKATTAGRTPAAKKVSSEVVDSKDYYVVVGTYPNQEQALDTFVRLSSISLPHATMESRKTKSGKMLHMVRLGPFHKQSEIDRVKDKLVSDGMSQFKVVIN